MYAYMTPKTYVHIGICLFQVQASHKSQQLAEHPPPLPGDALGRVGGVHFQSEEASGPGVDCADSVGAEGTGGLKVFTHNNPCRSLKTSGTPPLSGAQK